MASEKIIFHFHKGEAFHTYTWIIKPGFRGIRDAKKLYKKIEKWGSPFEIIGEGSVATLMRKELKIFNKDPDNYDGVPEIDILRVGLEFSGLPIKKLQEQSKKILKKLKRN